MSNIDNSTEFTMPLNTYAATVNSPDQSNRSYRGAHIIINTTTVNSGTFTPKIQGRDPISGNYYDILTGSAINAAGLTVLKVYPGITAAANAAVSDVLPRGWRIVMTGASTPSHIFSITTRMVL